MKVKLHHLLIAVAIIALALWAIPSRVACAAEKEKSEHKEMKAEREKGEKGEHAKIAKKSAKEDEEEEEAEEHERGEKGEKREMKGEKGERAKVAKKSEKNEKEEGEERAKGEKGERKEKGKNAEEKKPERETGQEEKVTLDQVPAAVRKTLERECKGATIRDITKEVEGEKTLYDFEVTREGRQFEFDIAANGEVLSREEQVELKQLPPAVRQTIERASKGGKLGTIMKGNEQGKTSYEAEITIKGKMTEIAVADNGKLITKAAEQEEEKEKAGGKEERGKVKGKEERGERKGEKREVKKEERESKKEERESKKEEGEEAVNLSQLPSAVQKTLKRESTGGTLGDITKEMEDGKVVYSADLKVGDDEYEIEIAANGKLIKKALEEEKEKEKGKEEGKAELKEKKAKPRKEKSERKEGRSGKEKKERERD